MAALPFIASAGEALVLGLATGPVCLASCGPVVLPWMLLQPQGLRADGRRLVLFLAARLSGYLVFATAAWSAGMAIPQSWTGRSWPLGAIEILLASTLLAYALGWPRCDPQIKNVRRNWFRSAQRPTRNGWERLHLASLPA